MQNNTENLQPENREQICLHVKPKPAGPIGKMKAFINRKNGGDGGSGGSGAGAMA